MFPCEKCACCCRTVGRSPLGKPLATADGVCRHLDRETNLCRIYSSRPLLCNIDAYYDLFMAQQMSREKFYSLNKKECRRLQAAQKQKEGAEGK